MNILFFPRIALTGIKNNKRLYIPFFITCIATIAMFYIMCYLSFDEYLASLPYVGSLQQITFVGVLVIGFFSICFLLYTNSFLTKRRRKEFGLYNVLGMSKTNIAVVLLFESLFTSLISIILGITCGVLFSKLSELTILNLINGTINYQIKVNLRGIEYSLYLFIPLFILLYLVNTINISKNNTIELVRSEQEGEKKPKANWLFGLSGIIILGFAYYLALLVDSGVSAVMIFFIAVILVIIATYLIFMSFSVVLCKILKKKKNYYYKTNNFISTSSMEFRMKRNGAGLASICILSTMVLVMISSTACLYFGVEDIINRKYPYDYQFEFRYDNSNDINAEQIAYIDQIIEDCVKDNGFELNDVVKLQYVDIAGLPKNGVFVFDRGYISDISITDLNYNIINIVPLSDYNRLTNKNVNLKDNEALMFAYDTGFNDDSINIQNVINYDLIKPSSLGLDENFEEGLQAYSGLVDTLCMVVNNYDEAKEIIMSQMEPGVIRCTYEYDFNSNKSDAEQIAFRDVLSNEVLNKLSFTYCMLQGRAHKTNDAYALYGSMFFLGISLSIMFIFATVLIIYYKQISEGYEDQPKFEIMKKVGITDREIRKTINTQMLTVFYLPLVMAITHLCFAFKMIKHLIALLDFTNVKPLIMATFICVIVYTIVYAIIYRITSNSYYSIVASDLKNENY